MGVLASEEGSAAGEGRPSAPRGEALRPGVPAAGVSVGWSRWRFAPPPPPRALFRCHGVASPAVPPGVVVPCRNKARGGGGGGSHEGPHPDDTPAAGTPGRRSQALALMKSRCSNLPSRTTLLSQ